MTQIRSLLLGMSPARATLSACLGQAIATMSSSAMAYFVHSFLLTSSQRAERSTGLDDPLQYVTECVTLAVWLLLIRYACSTPAILIGRLCNLLSWRRWFALNAGLAFVELCSSPADMVFVFLLGLHLTGHPFILDEVHPIGPIYLIVGVALRVGGAAILSSLIDENQEPPTFWLVRIALVGGSTVSSALSVFAILDQEF